MTGAECTQSCQYTSATEVCRPAIYFKNQDNHQSSTRLRAHQEKPAMQVCLQDLARSFVIQFVRSHGSSTKFRLQVVCCNTEGRLIRSSESTQRCLLHEHWRDANAAYLQFGFNVLPAFIEDAQHLQTLIFRHNAHARWHHGSLLGCLLLSMLLCQPHFDVLQVPGHPPILLLLQPPALNPELSHYIFMSWGQSTVLWTSIVMSSPVKPKGLRYQYSHHR